MSKFNKVFLLLITFTFLSTYSPQSFNIIQKKEKNFFSLKNIIVTNNVLVNKSDVKTKLHLVYNKNIFFLRKRDIENPLKDINFLKDIEVKKKYPNTILIKIYESKPAGILKKNKVSYLIDSESNLIPFNDNFVNLPYIFGNGAEKYFKYFLGKLRSNHFPIKTIKNFYYFQIGRWDIELNNRKIIKFPHSDINFAIKKSIELLKRSDFNKYNIIDLRVNGKIIVE